MSMIGIDLFTLVGYVLVAIRAAPVVLLPAVLLFYAFSPTVKSSMFSRACNAVLAFAVNARLVYLSSSL
jgi:hypothetical protein